MQKPSALVLVFVSGFVIMVLEIVGARLLAKDFGSSFYVWVSQIGVILIALALGYWMGGHLADRSPGSILWLSGLLIPAGAFTFLIPIWTPKVVEHIILRHPADQPIPLLWQKLDPALGSALVFLLPCVVLAALPPFMIRMASHDLAHVGRRSGLIYAASTVGSIAGVFVSGYVLIDTMRLSSIFRMSGVLIMLMGGLCLVRNLWFKPRPHLEPSSQDST